MVYAWLPRQLGYVNELESTPGSAATGALNNLSRFALKFPTGLLGSASDGHSWVRAGSYRASIGKGDNPTFGAAPDLLYSSRIEVESANLSAYGNSSGASASSGSSFIGWGPAYSGADYEPGYMNNDVATVAVGALFFEANFYGIQLAVDAGIEGAAAAWQRLTASAYYPNRVTNNHWSTYPRYALWPRA